MKRSLLVEGNDIPLGRILAPASRRDSPLLAPTLHKLDDIGPPPDDITVHLDAGYDSQKTPGVRMLSGAAAVQIPQEEGQVLFLVAWSAGRPGLEAPEPRAGDRPAHGRDYRLAGGVIIGTDVD